MAKLKIQSDVKPFTMVKNAIIDSEAILNEHEKILYIVLLRYGNKAFPSLVTLSKKCGFSKRTAQRTIDTLIEKGLLKKKNRIGKKNENTSNIYTLIDNDKIWYSSKEDLKENIETAILEEAVKIVEASGMKVLGKEKEIVSEPTKAQKQSHNKQKENKFSINNDTSNLKKSQDSERYSLELIHTLYEYEIMLHDYPYEQGNIDAVMNILKDALNTTLPTIRIGQEDKPAMVVISKLMKLNYSEIMYVIQKYKEQTERIRNPNNYILTMLYRAKEQMDLDITNQVQHDMYNWNPQVE